MQLYPKFGWVALLALISGFVSAQDDPNALAFQEYEYQWIKDCFVDTCPAEGGPLPFRLDDPTIASRTKAVILSYPVLIPDPEWLSYEIMDYSCTTTIPTGNSTTEFPFTSDISVTYDASSAALALLKIELNPYGLSEFGNLIYTETERSGVAPSIQSKGDVNICVRMSLWNGVPGSSSDVMEVTFSETKTSFGVEFTVDDESYLDFSTQQQRTSCTGSDCRKLNLVSSSSSSSRKVGASHQSKSKSRRLACDTTWGIQVFTCPDTIDLNSLVNVSGVTPNNAPLPTLSPIRLCFQPNDAAAQAGATIKDVQSLYYKSATSTQPAIEAGYISYDGLSTRECGDQVCVVVTNLSTEMSAETSIDITGQVLFQPSEATSYNQIKVTVNMTLDLTPQSSSDSSAGGAPPMLVATVSLMTTTLLLGAGIFAYMAV